MIFKIRRKTAATNVADSSGGPSAAKRRKKGDLVEAVKMAS